MRLHYDGNIDERSFSVNELAKYVGDHRLEILAELIGMVTGWLKAGRPLPSQPAQHSVSNEWAATIDAILQFNGYTGFLTNFEDATADADLDFHELLEICEVCQGEPKKTALAWAKCLSEKGLLRDQLYDLDSGFPKSDQAQATIVGTLSVRCVKVNCISKPGTVARAACLASGNLATLICRSNGGSASAETVASNIV